MDRNKLNVILKAEEAIKESFMILKSINDSLYSNWSNCIDPTQEEKPKAVAKMVYLFHKTSGFLELDVLKLIYTNRIHDQPSTKAKEVPIYSSARRPWLPFWWLSISPQQLFGLRYQVFVLISAMLKIWCDHIFLGCLMFTAWSTMHAVVKLRQLVNLKLTS